MSNLISLKRKSFEIVNKTATKAEIVIYAAIGASWFEESISAKQFSDEMKKIDSSVKELEVRVNSPGGDVFDGIAIYNRIKQFSGKKTVFVDGIAASIASVIALAGDEIVFSEGALMMIHKPWTMAIGNSLELENTINRLDDVEEQIVSIYQRKTKIDRSEIKEMMAKETWFDAKEALEKGFATSTMEKEAIAASMDKAEWIKRRPTMKTENDFIKEKLKQLQTEVEGFLAR